MKYPLCIITQRIKHPPYKYYYNPQYMINRFSLVGIPTGKICRSRRLPEPPMNRWWDTRHKTVPAGGLMLAEVLKNLYKFV